MAVILRTWKPGKLTKPIPQHKDQRRQCAALQPDCPHAINSSSCRVENSHLRRVQRLHVHQTPEVGRSSH